MTRRQFNRERLLALGRTPEHVDFVELQFERSFPGGKGWLDEEIGERDEHILRRVTAMTPDELRALNAVLMQQQRQSN